MVVGRRAPAAVHMCVWWFAHTPRKNERVTFFPPLAALIIRLDTGHTQIMHCKSHDAYVRAVRLCTGVERRAYVCTRAITRSCTPPAREHASPHTCPTRNTAAHTHTLCRAPVRTPPRAHVDASPSSCMRTATRAHIPLTQLPAGTLPRMQLPPSRPSKCLFSGG